MSEQSFTTSFTVDQSPEAVFQAINNVRGWWADSVEGQTDHVDAVFYYHHEDVHRSTIKVTELIPGQKVAWHVLFNYFSFVEDKTEWTDTDIIFDIAQKDGKTQVQFTHVGLVPSYECYEACHDGWTTYINGSLQNLITTGEGESYKGEARTESERALANN